MSLPYWIEREKLTAFQRALIEGKLTVGYIGGSITDGRPRHNWPIFVNEWLARKFPLLRVRIENAAIGATGSDLAVFRAKRDLLNRNCQLVFVEFAVNDDDEPKDKRKKTREGLLRQLIANGVENIVLIYTYCESMQEAIQQNEYPATIREFEQLADHYGLTSIWVGKCAYDDVLAGKILKEDWLPDGLHPLATGSRLYADCVTNYLEQHIEQLGDDHSVLPRLPKQLPPPLQHNCWEHVSEIPFSQIKTTGVWLEQRWHDYEWMDIVLETYEMGSSLSFEFEGRGIVLVFDFGKRSAEFNYSIDGSQWKASNRDCPDWVEDNGWYRSFDFGDDYHFGVHRFELVVCSRNSEARLGEYFRLGKVGVIR